MTEAYRVSFESGDYGDSDINGIAIAQQNCQIIMFQDNVDPIPSEGDWCVASRPDEGVVASGDIKSVETTGAFLSIVVPKK